MTTAITTFDFLIPTDRVIKISHTKKGALRYYLGSSRQGRFFPLSKKDFKALDSSKFEIFQELLPNCWAKVN